MNPRKLMRRMTEKTARHLAGATGLILCVLLGSCKTNTEDNDTTNAFVRVVSMGASAQDFGGAGEPVSDLFSDVCFADEDHPPCTYFNDNGVVTMTGFPKDQTQPSGVITDVTFERYRVTYVRADGRNVPGIDVPYPFDGAAQFTVPLDGSETERSFMVVRQSAKTESPLREMALTANILSVIAQVDFFGRDTAGRSITVRGSLNITFADFGNE
ncbi:MAG TPA: hypothetical protein VLK65_14475 [Vicinamibacteria bacterium]|nr:hypothetical protein [Vicinamibacteria bacterium]